MNQPTSDDSNEDLAVRLRLLETLESGVLDSIECPKCRRSAISIWFTHLGSGEYRTWFICAECPFDLRVQNSEMPRQFTPERIHARLQEYDSFVHDQHRLPHS